MWRAILNEVLQDFCHILVNHQTVKTKELRNDQIA